MSLGVEMLSSNRKLIGTAGPSASNLKKDPSVAQGLKQRNIEFMHHAVTVLKKMEEFGSSILYIAKDDELPVQRKSWRGPPQIERTLLIKATTASSKDDIRRAETEVKLLRKLRHHPCILKLIDSGFSTLDDEEDFPIENNVESSREISVSTKRLYCMLFEPCPDLPLWDLIAKQRRKQKQSKPRGFLRSFSRKSVLEESGYFHIATVLDMFLQMCEAIKAMHHYRKDNPSYKQRRGESKQFGILHLDVTPGRFLVRKITPSPGEKNARSTYEVKLCSFGCALSGSLSLRNDAERRMASRLLEKVTTDIYRAPEMVNYQLSEELTDRCDIWGLGCCFFAMLFLRECFRESSKLTIMNGKYRIPEVHPYSAKVLDLLDRMLTVVPEGRASIEEVVECIVAIQEGISLPPRRIMTMQLTGTTRNTGGSLEFAVGGIPRSIEVDSSTAPEDDEGKDRDEASESYTHYYTKALSDSAALTLCRSTNGSDTTGSSAVGGSLPEFSTGDDSASDDTQWLEFQPGKPNHTARRHIARNKQRKSSTKKKRRHNALADPLSLGKTESTRKKGNESEKNKSDWTLGVLNRLSSKSLTPIEPERSVDDPTDDGGFTVLKPSSHRKFTLSKVSKKRSGKSMSSAASLFLDTSSSTSPLEKSMRLSDVEKKHVASSANLDGYSGDDSAWGFDSSAQQESSNFLSDSEVDDLDLLPSDFVNASPLFPPTPEDTPDSSVGPAPSVESTPLSILNATLEPVKVPSIRSLDIDKSFVATADLDASGYNGDISQSMPKALHVSISQSETNSQSMLACDTSQSISTAVQAIIAPPEELVQSTLSPTFLINTSLCGILEEPTSQKNEDDETATVEYSCATQMNDIPLPDDFPFSTGDANSAPFNLSDNLAVERICLDVISSTRHEGNGLLSEVKSKSKRKTDKVDTKTKVSSKKAIVSSRTRKEKSGQPKGSSESRLNTNSSVSGDRNLEREASVGSKSTWDDFFGGRLDDSFSASKEGSSGPIGSSRSGGKNETTVTVIKAKENIKESPPSRNEKTIDTWQYSSPRQWASQQSFKGGSLPDTNAMKSKNSPASLVHVAKVKGGNKRKQDPQTVRRSSDGQPIDLSAVKKWVKDTTGKSIYGSASNGERPPELTPVEEPSRISDGSDSADVSPLTELENRRKRGSLDTFLARENAIAEFQEFIDYQEVVKYTEVKKDLVAECKVSVGAEFKNGSFVLSDAPKKTANASASSVFTPQHEKQRISGASRSVFSANELMWYKNGLQSTSHRLLESEIGQVLIPTDDEHEDEPQKRGKIQTPMADNTVTALLTALMVAPTQSTLHRDTSKMLERGSPYGPKATANIHVPDHTSDAKLVPTQSSMQREESKMTIDSNLPPPEEECVAQISRPPGQDTSRLSPTSDPQEETHALLAGDVADLDSERAKIESNAYKRFQRSKYRLDDNQPFSKIFSHRMTEQALGQSGKAENLLGSPEEYYSDDESEDFGIPLEIEIIPDHALSSPKSPKSKRKKAKTKKSRRKGSVRLSEYTKNELNYVASNGRRTSTEERGISMHSLHTRKK